jgi:hypothetical protein
VKRALTSCALCLVSIIAAGCPRQHESASKGSLAADPRGSDELVQHEFGLTAPYRLEGFSGVGDGGSLVGILVGANGDSLPFFWDNAMQPQASEDTPHNIYIGTRDRTGRRLDVRSQPELAFILALHAIAAQSFPTAKQDSLRTILFDYEIPMPQRLRALRWMDERQMLALEAARLATKLEVQRQVCPTEH